MGPNAGPAVTTPEWSEPRACVEIRCREAADAARADERARVIARVNDLPRLRRFIDDSELVDLADVLEVLTGHRP